MCLVGDPYKPSFATVTVRGDTPKNTTTKMKQNMQPQIDPIIYLVGGGKLPSIRKDMN